VKSTFGLVIVENIPQLIIQIIYYAVTQSDNNTSVAFYVTILTTSMHLVVQFYDCFEAVRYLYNAYQGLPSTNEKRASTLALDNKVTDTAANDAA
jgi:hypothetical protein